MSPTVNPQTAVDAVFDAVAPVRQRVAIFAESSSPMFYATHALCKRSEASPYCQISTHYGSMGHAIGGALGFCAATGQRAVVLTGDGSFHLMNPLPAAVKHGYRITMVVLNDSRLGLPFFGSNRIGAFHAQATTQLAKWDFTRQGSPRVGGRRVAELVELEAAMTEALGFDGCFVIDVEVNPDVVPPVGERFASVAALSRGTAS